MKLSTILKGIAIVCLPGGLTLLVAWWAMQRRNRK